MSNVDALLNPETRELVVGIRDAEMIKVYPLSYFDQKNIGEAVVTYLSKNSKALQKGGDLDFIGSLAIILEEKLPFLLEKCVDMPADKFMANTTAGQIMEFVTIVMEVNFLNPIQKGTKLFENMGYMLAGNQLSPQSVSDTDTN
jgi:hypothetical protein